MEDIINLFTGLGFVAVYLLLFMAFLIFVFVQAKKRRSLQQTLTQQAQQVGGADSQILSVKYAAGKNFNSIVKIVPWDGAGVLRLGDNRVIFQGQTSGGQPLELVFSPSETRVSWIGRKFVNGATSWFLLEANGVKHYFTAETGVTIVGSKDNTRGIMETVANHLNAAGQSTLNP